MEGMAVKARLSKYDSNNSEVKWKVIQLRRYAQNMISTLVNKWYKIQDKKVKNVKYDSNNSEVIWNTQTLRDVI